MLLKELTVDIMNPIYYNLEAGVVIDNNLINNFMDWTVVQLCADLDDDNNLVVIVDLASLME